jgi:hypothetical protein
MPRNKPATHISERNLAIWHARRAGRTYDSIAREHGITLARARQVYETWARRFDCSWRTYFIPPELLAHNWTPEDQWHEIQKERTHA